MMTHRPGLSAGQRSPRRVFLKDGVVFLSAIGAALPSQTGFAADPATPTTGKPALRIALMTDLHHADKDANGTRHYRETLGKLDEAARHFQENPPDLLVELGDIIDAADSVDTELHYLETINRPFSMIAEDRHYVLGNHCVDTLTKQEFLSGVGQERSYYSFDRSGIHFVVLDSCFRSDGTAYGRRNFTWTDANIPNEELQWLKADLKDTDKPVVVFAHQRLDVSDNHGVKNASQVRAVLENCGQVSAVFQGHSHQNDLREIGGIFYCTLVAMIEGSGRENNAYSMLEVMPDGSLRLQGFRKQLDRNLPRKS